ncbi:MAG: hypothetical protein JXX14_12520 [Deltaproteobacteria bacterium]|nr:hypothetical protein [Deltaproteobacteria bacterium]
MNRFATIVQIVLFIHLFSIAIYCEESDESVSRAGMDLLARGEGAVTDATFALIAQKLTLSDFKAALYGNSRVYRRVALDAAAYVSEPWEYMPYLVSFMSAAERQSASTAAQSIFVALERAFDMRHGIRIPVSKQSRQMTDMLSEIAMNDALSKDIRVAAIRCAARIAEMTNQPLRAIDAAINNSDVDIQVTAMQMLSLPLSDNYLNTIGRLATENESEVVRGVAVALLCENARSHQVVKPSADLKSLVVEIIQSAATAETVAPALACMARFQYRVRADLSDKINSCGNEKIVKYWKTLSQ